jgi:N6-L-threonylcarbamoyladenine synthase
MLVLGIEYSCDETAAALVEDGHSVLSNVVASQVKTHRNFGGVVPELASREHLRNIGYVVRQAFRDAKKTQADLDGIAVTQGPGLIGSLPRLWLFPSESRWFPSTISKGISFPHL